MHRLQIHMQTHDEGVFALGLQFGSGERQRGGAAHRIQHAERPLRSQERVDAQPTHTHRPGERIACTHTHTHTHVTLMLQSAGRGTDSGARTLVQHGSGHHERDVLQRLHAPVSCAQHADLRQTQHQRPRQTRLTVIPAAHGARDITTHQPAGRREAF